MIEEATRQKKISLLVRSYGHGTDFICLDKKVLDNSGVHVIQTFLSQETQIKGRTARQGDPGSYELVLSQNQLLQKFNITSIELQRNRGSKLYQFLHNKRNDKFDQKCKLTNQQIEDARVVHESSINFYQSLIMKKFDQVTKGLQIFNKGSQVKKYRTVIFLEVTESMGSIMQNIKSIIHQTMNKIKTFLTQQNYHEDSIEIQLVCYRSYNSSLLYSNWETKAQNLSKFVQYQKFVSDRGAFSLALNFIYKQNIQNKPNPVNWNCSSFFNKKLNRDYKLEKFNNRRLQNRSTEFGQKESKYIAFIYKINPYKNGNGSKPLIMEKLNQLILKILANIYIQPQQNKCKCQIILIKIYTQDY